MDMVNSFRYLEQVILAADNNWLAVVKNLSWARTIWRRMLRILRREGAAMWLSGLFFKAVVQAVLLLGLETLVVTTLTGKALGGFQTQVARRLIPRRTQYGKWRYTSTETAREEAGFLKMEECIRRHQNTVAQYIATQSLLDLCGGGTGRGSVGGRRGQGRRVKEGK